MKLHLAHLALLLVVLAPEACGSPPAPVQPLPDPLVVTPSPSASAASLPAHGAGDAPDPQALKLTAAHNTRLAFALSRIPSIAETVATIRHLPLKHPVPAAEQTQADFRRFLDAEVAKEMPPAKTAQSVRALVRLGFLKESIDLDKTVEEAMLSQAGAYYDPETKKFYLVIVPEDETMLDVMSAHELTHALDDQYFDLTKYTEDPQHLLSNDASLVRRLVTEGEATLIMLAYEAKTAAHQDIFAPESRSMEQAMVATFAALDSEKLAKAAVDNPEMIAQMGPEMKASIDAMATIPPFILDPLFGAYTKGAAAVAAVRDAGGWDAVGALYTNPPESTEQLLHPAEKLIAKRDHPVVLTFPPTTGILAGLTPIDEDVIGEMTMAVYFKNWGDLHPTAEVTGWGGDRYAAYDVGGDGTSPASPERGLHQGVIAVWLTTWDTEADAKRFAAAYEKSWDTRFFGTEPAPPPRRHVPTGIFVHRDGTATVVARRGKDVAIVDGAPEASVYPLVEWLAKSKRTQAK